MDVYWFRERQRLSGEIYLGLGADAAAVVEALLVLGES